MGSFAGGQVAMTRTSVLLVFAVLLLGGAPATALAQDDEARLSRELAPSDGEKATDQSRFILSLGTGLPEVLNAELDFAAFRFLQVGARASAGPYWFTMGSVGATLLLPIGLSDRPIPAHGLGLHTEQPISFARSHTILMGSMSRAGVAPRESSRSQE